MGTRFRKDRDQSEGRSRLFSRGRQAVLGAAAFLVALQAALTLWIDYRYPQRGDPEYRIRLGRLQARLAEQPDRPLVLMLGSSRVLTGFRPERLNHLAAAAEKPVLSFNFGLLYAGPLRQHCALQHLQAANVRPKLLLLELMPPLFNQPGKNRFCEENVLYVPPMTLADLGRLYPFVVRSHRLFLPWVVSRLRPGSEFHQRVFLQMAAGWLPPAGMMTEYEHADDWGWTPTPTGTVTPEEQRDHIDAARRQYEDVFPDFRLGREPVRVLHTMLEICRREGIAVRLIRMPEGTAFRRMYTESMESQVEALVHELNERWGVATVNAREWIADADFWDSHHLLPSGAAEFSDRLGREVVLPWLHELNAGKAAQ